MPLLRTRTAEAQEAPAAVITLLTDYGSANLYVGLLHGVIARICPTARVIDLSHTIPAGDVVGGALALADAIPYLPVGFHVVVVDPGVGTERRALALRARDGRVLIGPDNGVLELAARAAGGIDAAIDITDSPLALDPISATFHGRDIFAPVAAALASGRSFVAAGAVLEIPDDLIALDLPRAQVDADAVAATITTVDHFGNLAVLATPADLSAVGLELEDVVSVLVGDRRRFARYGLTFGDVGSGRLLLHEDSTGRLALAVNGGSAAELLGADAGQRVTLSRAA